MALDANGRLTSYDFNKADKQIFPELERERFRELAYEAMSRLFRASSFVRPAVRGEIISDAFDTWFDMAMQADEDDRCHDAHLCVDERQPYIDRYNAYMRDQYDSYMCELAQR
jgi:hypothetical protein